MRPSALPHIVRPHASSSSFEYVEGKVKPRTDMQKFIDDIWRQIDDCIIHGSTDEEGSLTEPAKNMLVNAIHSIPVPKELPAYREMFTIKTNCLMALVTAMQSRHDTAQSGPEPQPTIEVQSIYVEPANPLDHHPHTQAGGHFGEVSGGTGDTDRHESA